MHARKHAHSFHIYIDKKQQKHTDALHNILIVEPNNSTTLIIRLSLPPPPPPSSPPLPPLAQLNKRRNKIDFQKKKI